jgi:sugar transferase (PEP-CTERM system associated)
VIRLFNLYFPTRTLVLLAGEVATICASFALAIFVRFWRDSPAIFNGGHAFRKIVAVTALALLCSYFMEMYDLRRLAKPGEMYPRILTLVGILSFLLAAFTYFIPGFNVGRNVFLTGLCILSFAWILWRWAYGKLIFLPALRERVYLLGDGERARRLQESIRTRAELGMDIVGWSGEASTRGATREAFGGILRNLAAQGSVDRIIVALKDRRSAMPVNELLELRLSGIRIEDGTALLEKIFGQVEVDELHPSWLIFGEGFRLTQPQRFLRPVFSVALALILSILTLPLIPIIVIVIKLSSPGPVLYRQKRVGLRGRVFKCAKFRTMQSDAEADSGPTWASDDDPRITNVGKFLRLTRLDEIPQLWNVLRGEMEFVGPRPERPEFVERLTREIPYYQLRHTVAPGITGWAQVCYKYGNTIEDAKEKLRYDLFYIKNMSPSLDLWILFQTIKTVLLGKGAL